MYNPRARFFGKVAVIGVFDDFNEHFGGFQESQDHLAKVKDQGHQGVWKELGHPQGLLFKESCREGICDLRSCLPFNSVSGQPGDLFHSSQSKHRKASVAKCCEWVPIHLAYRIKSSHRINSPNRINFSHGSGINSPHGINSFHRIISFHH